MDELPQIEVRLLSPELCVPLGVFFREIREHPDYEWFHPHPFSPEEAACRCSYTGKDLYYAVTASGNVLAYGMLRGWDDGYEIPSLGIAVKPELRGSGLGTLFMQFLQFAARRRGCRKMRLKVSLVNQVALGLYRKLGYKFGQPEGGELIGYLDLT